MKPLGNFLKTEEGVLWLQTDDGILWLKTDDGILWLETDAGKTWLASPEGKEYVVGEVLRIAALPDSEMFARLGQAILAIEKAQKERGKKDQA